MQDGNRIERKGDLHAPVSKVWKALSDHREFGEWFRVKLEAPFRKGKEASGKILHPGMENITWRAVIQKIEPESLFSFTWHPYAVEEDVDYSEEQPTLVEFHLEKIPEGTRLTIIESGFDQVPAARREEAFRMHEEGWTIQLQNVKKWVES